MTTAVARARRTRRRTRIQEENEEKILDAALEVFSTWGFRGATVDQIAALAGMTKPNLLYYFRRKEDIYLAVLNRTHEMWLEPLEHLDPEGDPAQEVAAYIDRKLEMSRDNPKASRLFAMEIIQGAPILRPVLEGRLRHLVDRKAAVIRAWIAAGKIAPVDPHHLIFMIWAATQTYADFETQIRAVLGPRAEGPLHFAAARATLEQVFLGGLNGEGRRAGPSVGAHGARPGREASPNPSPQVGGEKGDSNPGDPPRSGEYQLSQPADSPTGSTGPNPLLAGGSTRRSRLGEG
jgi:TetR/AcrR family transcriptional regulator